MRYFILIVTFFAISRVEAQQVIAKAISERTVGKSKEIVKEITFSNNSPNFICLVTSVAFSVAIDTIELGLLGDPENDSYYFSMGLSKADALQDYNDVPSYPLILAPYTMYVVKIRFRFPTSSKTPVRLNWNFSNQKDINFCELLGKYKDGTHWKRGLNIQSSSLQID